MAVCLVMNDKCLVIGALTTDGFAFWVKTKCGVAKVCAQDKAGFGGLIAFDDVLIIAWGDVEFTVPPLTSVFVRVVVGADNLSGVIVCIFKFK